MDLTDKTVFGQQMGRGGRTVVCVAENEGREMARAGGEGNGGASV